MGGSDVVARSGFAHHPAMTAATGPASDATLIDATLAALRDERRRAPADLLGMLTVLLVLAAGIMLAIGIVLGDGVAGDVFINLTSELLGVALTVGLIGGLWPRFQSYSEGALEGLVARTAERRAGTLSEDERVMFAAIVDLHERTAKRTFPVRIASGFLFAVRNRRRLRAVEDMLRAA
jgi:hypothetical protein